MRRGRLKVPEGREVGFYHCISRVVDRRRVLREVEKEHFAALMRECEAFCEVRVLTYCLMSNHFHILVEVPRRPEVLPSPEEILAKVRRLTGHSQAGVVEQRLKLYREARDEAGLRAYLETFYGRMWDVSPFMKMLKQRFTQWYNGRRGRKGTLWEERFKSVVVEGRGQALAAMAAYIDLNPVRAGILRDPRGYRWCGYGEAMAGQRKAREGLRVIATALESAQEPTLSRGVELYRRWLFNQGDEQRESADEQGRPVRGVLRREEVLEVLKNKGRLPLGAYVRCRVRYFCDGAVVGSRGFVEDLFRTYRARYGPRRKDGARRMRGLAKGDLYAMRDLRLGLFG